MNDYIKQLEEANANLQEKLAVAETLINGYKNVEFIFLPVYKKEKLIRLTLSISFKDNYRAFDIAILNKHLDKNTWVFIKGESSSDAGMLVTIPYSDDLKTYIEYMLSSFDISNVPYTIKV
jgi:hypothetical protein